MKLTVTQKILTGFVSVSILLLAISIMSTIFLRNVTDSYSDIVDRRVEIQTNFKEIVIKAQEQSSAVLGSLIRDGEESRSTFNSANEDIDVLIEETRVMLTIPEYLEVLDQLEQSNREYAVKYNSFLEFLQSDPTLDQKITYWQKELDPIGTGMVSLSSEYAQGAVDKMREANEVNKENVSNINTIIIIISVATIIMAVVIGIVISRMIGKPIVKVTEATEKMAAGDLTIDPITVKNKDELGILANSFNTMLSNVRGLVKEVQISTELVAASSEQLMSSAEQTAEATNQISTSIQEVSSGSKNQELSVEESSRAVQEMAIGVHRVANATSTVSDVSVETTKEAEEGNETIQNVVIQMNKINESTNDTAIVIRNLEERSSEIVKIIEVITNISNQTNLLALNAAIEAARAGEHGKGFAVVADEVRKLAEQSKESADQISNLIREIQSDTERAVVVMEKGTDEVAVGMSVVQNAGKSFERIQQSISQMSSQIQEISAVSQQMSASAEEVSAAIEEVAVVAKQSSNNAEYVATASEEQLASMEEITASSMALSKRAEELLEKIRQFKA